jgi:hypothetical protein
MDQSGSGSCPVACFGITNGESSGSAASACFSFLLFYKFF